MYAMLSTRPDLAFSVSGVSRYASNPNSSHWQAVKRIFRDIRGTLSLQLTYYGTLSNLEGYTDADWVGDYDTRRSTSGYIFMWEVERSVGHQSDSLLLPYLAVKQSTWGKLKPQKKQCG